MNITLSLKKSSMNSSSGVQEWWIVNQTERGPIRVGSKTEQDSCLEIYVFSDQVSPPSLGFLAGYGYVNFFFCSKSKSLLNTRAFDERDMSWFTTV